jgi:hypothetical protein
MEARNGGNTTMTIWLTMMTTAHQQPAGGRWFKKTWKRAGLRPAAMPSTSLQSRISAFETLSGPSTSSTSHSQFAKSPLVQVNSLLETPLSPSISSLPAITPLRVVSRSPSPSPPNLGRKTSLIDLKDRIVDDGPFPPHSNGSGNLIP